LWKGLFLPLSFSLHNRKGRDAPFVPYRSNQMSYRLLSYYKAVPYDIFYIVPNSFFIKDKCRIDKRLWRGLPHANDYDRRGAFRRRRH
jgi:hypothetical protein